MTSSLRFFHVEPFWYRVFYNWKQFDLFFILKTLKVFCATAETPLLAWICKKRRREGGGGVAARWSAVIIIINSAGFTALPRVAIHTILPPVTTSITHNTTKRNQRTLQFWFWIRLDWSRGCLEAQSYTNKSFWNFSPFLIFQN